MQEIFFGSCQSQVQKKPTNIEFKMSIGHIFFLMVTLTLFEISQQAVKEMKINSQPKIVATPANVSEDYLKLITTLAEGLIEKIDQISN